MMGQGHFVKNIVHLCRKESKIEEYDCSLLST
jgi:hypothetical protein